jgi:hypothetical protein
MPLVSQTEYARRRGVTRAAVWKRTMDAGGPIPTYGPDKKLNQAEADRLWAATMSSQGLANSRHPQARDLAAARGGRAAARGRHGGRRARAARVRAGAYGGDDRRRAGEAACRRAPPEPGRRGRALRGDDARHLDAPVLERLRR